MLSLGLTPSQSAAGDGSRLRLGLRSALHSRVRRAFRSVRRRCHQADLFLSLCDAVIRLARPTPAAKLICNTAPWFRDDPAKPLPSDLLPRRVPSWFKQLLRRHEYLTRNPVRSHNRGRAPASLPDDDSVPHVLFKMLSGLLSTTVRSLRPAEL